MISPFTAEKLGLNNGRMTPLIEEWEEWWRGGTSFHEYYENPPGGRPVRRKLYSLKMAKKVCEDWASMLINDRTEVLVPDAGRKAVVDRVLDASFYAGANSLVEKAFATGTGAALLKRRGSSMTFEFVDASHIFPLTVVNGQVLEAAFVSENVLLGGERYLYVERHELNDDGTYRILNELYKNRDGEPVRADISGFCEPVTDTGSSVPYFSLLTPNITNTADMSSGLGMSVFADAVDCLKGVDLAFNNFCRDIKLGGKKVFINQSLVYRDENGNVFTPDDVAQQLFVTVGDTDISDTPMITEHNPELRAEEDALAVRSQLSYLAFRCGLGTGYYTFDRSEGLSKMTATQYMGERQDLRRNAERHQKNVKRFLKGCAEAVLSASGESAEGVEVSTDDTYFSDSASERERALEEFRAGAITREEYRRIRRM